MLIGEVQLELDALAAQILGQHPELYLEHWSHSLGEANPLDGWTLGLVVHGREFPLEVAVDLGHLRRQPRLLRRIAEWLVPPDRSGFIWMDFQGTKDFAEGCEAVLKALKHGLRRGHSFGAAGVVDSGSLFIPSRFKSALSCDELEVYDCWLEYHRGISPVAPHLMKQTEMFSLHPESEFVRNRLAELLGTRPEVVNAVFPEEVVPPKLLGSKVVPAEPGWSIGDFRFWRRLYREKPLCTGLLYLSNIGFTGDRAALLTVQITGSGEAIDTVFSVLSFQKTNGKWRFLENQLIPWQSLPRAMYAGTLYLATLGVGHLTAVELSGDPVQPTLDLTWELPDGRREYLKVTRGPGASDANTCYLDFVSPDTVAEAVEEHFRSR